jgi:hypothetical protein
MRASAWHPDKPVDLGARRRRVSEALQINTGELWTLGVAEYKD